MQISSYRVVKNFGGEYNLGKLLFCFILPAKPILGTNLLNIWSVHVVCVCIALQLTSYSCMHNSVLVYILCYSPHQSAEVLDQCYSVMLTFLKDCDQLLSHPESICLLTRSVALCLCIHVFVCVVCVCIFVWVYILSVCVMCS